MTNLPDLFDYQKRYVQEIVEQPFRGLPLEPGMGKTRIMLEAMRRLFLKGEITSVLLIAPLCVASETWQLESKYWGFDFTFQLLHGKDKRHQVKNAHFYIINSEALSSRNGEQDITIPLCSALIVDESSLFKNHTSSRFKSLKNLVCLFNRRHIMTGTPVPKSYGNLWSQIYLLDEGERLGKNITTFRKQYCQREKYNQYSVIPALEKEIENKIKDIFFHATPKKETDVIFQNLYVSFSDSDKKAYNQLKNNGIAEINGHQIETNNSQTLRSMLRQMSGGAFYLDEGVVETSSAKLEALKNLAQELQGEPLMVAYNFKHELARIKKILKGRVEIINGGVGTKKRNEIAKNWNDKKIDFLLVQPMALSFGVNLQHGGNHLCWFSLPEDCEKYTQLNARLDRTGQTKTVVIHHIIAKGTLDAPGFKVLKNKESKQDDFLSEICIKKT